MTTMKQAATIELRLHVHSQLCEIIMTQCNHNWETANNLSYNYMVGLKPSELNRVKSGVDNGSFDNCEHAFEVEQIIITDDLS